MNHHYDDIITIGDITLDIGDTMSTGTTYTLGAAPTQLGINMAESGAKTPGPRLGHRFPNKKVSLSIHEAHGGYVVEIGQDSYGVSNEIYVISENSDFDKELGKIITHHTLTS